jgi:hypothetical protein
MLILFDNGTPAPLRHELKNHEKIAFVVIGNQQWPVLRRYVDRVITAIDAATPGSFAEVEIPFA